MKTKFQDYGSNHAILEVEDKEPIPDTIVLLDENNIASTYKAVLKSKKTKAPYYQAFDYEQHKEGCYYCIECGCSNCFDNRQIAIPIQTKVDLKILSNTKCPKCQIVGTLRQVKWNGKCYE